LTLIELLAVIVIVAMTTGVLATGFGLRRGDAVLRDVAAGWRDLDARARLLAQTVLDEGDGATRAIVMAVTTDGRELSLLDRRGARLASIALPEGIAVRLTLTQNGPAEPIVFDRLGRSADYDLHVSGARRALRYTVAGLTGLVRGGGS
jgi:type II secretory pathway pseudopilin PulG